MSATLQTKQVWKVYDTGTIRVEALRGIEVEIQAGETVAVMGPSGCGKTTLLNCISGLDDLSAGEVMVEGHSLFGQGDYERTRIRGENFGFIFQNFNLIPVLSAVENVELPLLLKGLRSGEAREKSLNALEAVGLREWAEHKPMELSGGQQQRVSIARAFVHQPAFILGDEPTGNLDSATSLEVMDLLFKFNHDHGTTLLVVTHDAEIARRFDRILQMQDGMIVQDISNTGEENPAEGEPAGVVPVSGDSGEEE
jgi:putative ABC transport system ATP-binding protein